MLFTLVPCVLFVYWHAFRRFRPPPYTTQKYSRMSLAFTKTHVPALLVPWSVKHASYAPVVIPAAAYNGEHDHHQEDTVPSSWFRDAFCFVPHWWFWTTRADGTLRFLAEVSPVLFSRMPTNPYGRTGCSGRGQLPHLGPNPMVYTVVVSPSSGKCTRVLYRKEGKLAFRGYLDHPFNTDNAWVEAEVYVTTEPPDAYGTSDNPDPDPTRTSTRPSPAGADIVAMHPWLVDVLKTRC